MKRCKVNLYLKQLPVVPRRKCSNELKSSLDTKSYTNTLTIKRKSSQRRVIYSVKSRKSLTYTRVSITKLDPVENYGRRERNNPQKFDEAALVPQLSKQVTTNYTKIINNLISFVLKNADNKSVSSRVQNLFPPFTKTNDFINKLFFNKQITSLLNTRQENSNVIILKRSISYGKVYKIMRRNLSRKKSWSSQINPMIAAYKNFKHKPSLCKKCKPKPRKISGWRKYFQAFFREEKPQQDVPEKIICEKADRSICPCVSGKKIQNEIKTTKSATKCDIEEDYSKYQNDQSYFKSMPPCEKRCKTNSGSSGKPCEKDHDDSDLLTCANIKRRQNSELQSNLCDEESQPKPPCSAICKKPENHTKCSPQQSEMINKLQNIDCDTSKQKSEPCDLKRQSEINLLLTCKNLREMLGFKTPHVDRIPEKSNKTKMCKTDVKTPTERDKWEENDKTEECQNRKFNKKKEQSFIHNETDLCQEDMKGKDISEDKCREPPVPCNRKKPTFSPWHNQKRSKIYKPRIENESTSYLSQEAKSRDTNEYKCRKPLAPYIKQKPKLSPCTDEIRSKICKTCIENKSTSRSKQEFTSSRDSTAKPKNLKTKSTIDNLLNDKAVDLRNKISTRERRFTDDIHNVKFHDRNKINRVYGIPPDCTTDETKTISTINKDFIRFDRNPEDPFGISSTSNKTIKKINKIIVQDVQLHQCQSSKGKNSLLLKIHLKIPIDELQLGKKK